MKKIGFIIICIISFVLPKKSIGQNNDKINLTITVYESTDQAYNKIFVFQNDKKIEEIEYPTLHHKSLEAHQSAIIKTLLKYKDQGYKKDSELRGNASPNGLSIMITTYTFEK